MDSVTPEDKPVTGYSETEMIDFFISEGFMDELLRQLGAGDGWRVWFRVGEPVVPDRKGYPGDIDMLAYHADCPERALGVQCKVLTVEVGEPNLEGGPNRDTVGWLSKRLQKAVSQSNGTWKLGFWKTILVVFVEIDASVYEGTQILLPVPHPGTSTRVYSSQVLDGLQKGVGLLFVDVVQPGGRSIRGRGSIDYRWASEPIVHLQDEGLTDRIRCLPLWSRGWRSSTLGDIADIKGGLTKGKKRPPGTVVRSVRYLRVANVQKGYLDLHEMKEIEATEEEIDELRLVPGDVLLNEGGDRDKLGRGWVWSGEIRECIHQNHVFRARLRGGMNPRFVSLYGCAHGQKYFMEEGAQTTNLASFNLTKLSAFPVVIPPLPEQRRIVAKIEELFTHLDAGVAGLKRAKALLKRYRASVLKAACEGRLVPTEAELARQEGRSYEPAAVLLERILKERRKKWEENGKKGKYKEPVAVDAIGLPELPEGWVWTAIGQLTLSLESGNPATAADLASTRPVLRSSAVRQGRIDFADSRFLPEEAPRQDAPYLRPGDLLFTRLSGSLEYVGNCAVVPELCGRLLEFPDRIFRGVCSQLVLPHWVQHCAGETGLRKPLEQTARSTAGHQRISLSDLKAFRLPLPPLAEQHRIVAEVERLLSLADNLDAMLTKHLTQSDRLRQSILKRAFEGKLVPQDPTDEPASVLLERIRKEREAQPTSKKPRRRAS